MSHVNRALSREGHAAMSMRGETDRWILIQKNTFTNWVNEQLRIGGNTKFVEDLQTAFEDGVLLCALIESLQGKKIGRVIKKPLNHHQNLENCTLALTAIANDNVRLVNIGSDDISNGNLKLILGLIWHLILRYQIGKTKFPAKKLMLAWLRAVIPECNITNFTTCWNDGVALHALVNYCDPKIEEATNWRYLSHSDSLNTCSNAMNLAKKHFDIPLVVRPEDLSSPDLDELSGMTYLSYFMKIDSPGYMATRNMTRNLLKSGSFNNFTDDWSDGHLLCNLVTSLGESASPVGSPEENLQLGIDAARRLGVEPILTAKEMCDPEVDHIGIMAYAAYFGNFKPVRTAAEKVVMEAGPRNVYIDQEADFSLRIDDTELVSSDVRAEIKGPDSNPPVHFNWVGSRATGTFTPTETGHHRLNVYCENSLIVGCPVSFKVIADRSRVRYIGPDKCSAGLISELKVDVTSAGQGDIQCEARAPNGRSVNLAAVYRHGNYVMNFTPTEVGLWQVSVLYDGEHISDSPFNVMVFDPSKVRVYGLEGGAVGMGLKFHSDTSEAGTGEVTVQVSCNGSHVPAYIHQDRVGLYSIDFTPQGAGTYKVEVYFNDMEVRGSPYTLEIVDSAQVTVSGDGLSLVPVNRTASFVVDTQGSGSGNVDVEIMAPSGAKVKSMVTKDRGQHHIEYSPTESGDHQIFVSFCEQPLQGSPFICRVYDVGQVVITNMPNFASIGKTVKFQIDASKAGSGNIEIMVNDGRIPCSVQNLGNYCFNASFVPDNIDPHIIQMKFNNKPVTGSPWKIPILDMKKALKIRSEADSYVLCDRTARFEVEFDGDLKDTFDIQIRAPGGGTVPFNIVQDSGQQTIEYVPEDVGDHQINLKYMGNDVDGSPFTAKAYDTSAIIITPLKNGLVGSSFDFTIDVSRAGEGQLEIMVNNGNLPNTVELERPSVYRITFTPTSAGKQYVDINFNSESLPGSPFSCLAYDGAGVTLTGMDNVIPANRSTSFNIQCESDEVTPEVEVSSLSGVKAPLKVMTDGNEKIVTYTPKVAGDHLINIRVGYHHLGDSPYKVKVFDPRKVKAIDIPSKCYTGNPCTFQVDATEAGDGILEVVILCEGKTIPHKLTSLDNGFYEVTFTGDEPYRHRVHMTLNEELVKGSPFWVEYVDEMEEMLAEFERQQFVQLKTQAGITFKGTAGMLDQFSTEIIAPSGSKLPAKIREMRPGWYCVEWKPTEIGSHLVEVFFAGSLIPGFPSVVKVFDANKVKLLTQLGRAEVGEVYELTFLVDEAGEGRLEVVVECEGETIPSFVERRKEGQLTTTFTPRAGKKHLVSITFNDQHVPGSPFVIMVEDLEKMVTRVEETVVTSSVTKPLSVDVQPLSVNVHTHHLQIDKRQWFVLETYGGNIDSQNLQIQIIAPNGIGIPARLVSQSGGNFRVEWTPTTPVDFADAGSLENTIQVFGPSGRSVDSNQHGDYLKTVSYYPDEAGPHNIFVTYAGFELPGCPFIQNIDDGGLPTADGDGLFRGEEDNVATFYVHVGKRRGELGVQVDGPNSIAKTTIEPAGDRYVCTYTPVEVGIFTLQLQWNGKDLPGSPFHPKIVDPRKVKIYGGWQHLMDSQERVKLVVGEEKRLVFDVSQAGPGIMKAEVQGPSSSLPVMVDSHTVGQNVICFTPEEEGNHYIHLFWAERTLPNSPFIGYAVRVAADANKVILTGRGLKEAKVREEAEFVIDGSQAGSGVPEVTLSGVRAEISNRVVPLGNGRFHCTYTPIIPGAYLLHITWNGRQLKGSPYKVNVIGAFFPHKVSVTGEGLKGGIMGKTSDVYIDVRKAGPGELTAACMGPSKVANVDLHDNRDGTFQLGIKPMEVGRHVLQVKYGGEHVLGSPFILKVGSQPDASKVRVTGPGVEHGILATFQSSFVVETRGAGAGQLTVRIRGPKGGFQVEMYRDSQRDRTILCRYDPTETGLYIISIRWSGVDVPGSPFQINIVDTQQELEHLLQEQSFSNSSATPRTYAQWKAEI
ncbi:filamin-C-like [Ylistrum balloti]|uniref:filamin-C-like n=1 Tax=Ylistrum balloti TaxID=509963 RepID=UPI002905D754|nr:filamin-C-like [Ylistrum balloti]